MKTKGGRLNTGKLSGDWSKIEDPVLRRAAWIKENQRQRYFRNRADIAWVEANRRRSSEWGMKNRAIVNYNGRKKFAVDHGIARTDSDISLEKAIYSECHRLNSLGGKRYCVDHIIPICYGGLHHHLNLQILPFDINISKHGDPIWLEDGFKSWKDVPEFLWPPKLVPVYTALKNIKY